MKDNDLLTLDEVATLCRTSPSTVYHWRYMGRGPRAIKLGRRLLFRRSDVTMFLESHLGEASPQSIGGGQR